MMGEDMPETCWTTHKRQVINLWNCYILLVELFVSYDDARAREIQIDWFHISCTKVSTWMMNKIIDYF
jgi:hypothetical protein